MISNTKKIKKIRTFKIVEKHKPFPELVLDEEVLNAVKVQDAIREKYNVDKNWNSVEIIRKIRDNS